MYGSSRLGIYKTQDTLRTVDLSLVYKLSDVTLAPTQTLSKKEFYFFDSAYTHKRGDKLYEGSNHLGNVLVTFSDKRIATCTEGQVHYQADVRSATDYAAFHSQLDDRQWYSSTDSAFYRYGGSNGQEKDDEIYGTGNSYSAEFWQYDPRLGRRWNVDPKPNPSFSFYSCFGNNPINYLDVKGDTITFTKEFLNNKFAMKAYNKWANSKSGKKFIQQYSIGGKYGNVSVVFGIFSGEDDGSDGETSSYTVDKLNREKRLITQSEYDQIGNKEKYALKVGQGEFLRFKINLDPIDIDKKMIIFKGDPIFGKESLWLRRMGLTILHETQHIAIEHYELLVFGKRKSGQKMQHKIMKADSPYYIRNFYRERLNFILEHKLEGETSNDWEREVNAFEDE